MNLKGIFLSVSLACITLAAFAQTSVWQWAIPVRNFSQRPKNPEAYAYLWIPEKCKQVKAILVAQHNMEEISIMEDERFRHRMAYPFI